MSIVGPRTLSLELAAKVARHPHKTWLTFEDRNGGIRQFTYAEFSNLADRTASGLAAIGVGPGDKLLLHLDNCPEFMALWFAAAATGAVIVPVNTLSSPDELLYLIEHSESVAMVTQAGLVESVRQLLPRCPRVRRLVVVGETSLAADETSFTDLVAGETPAADHAARPSDVVSILYTSGTTSKPKGCLITNANYIHVGECVSKAMRLSHEDRFLTVLPLFHGNSQYYATMSSLVVGASVVLTERFSASRYWIQAARHGCTVGSLFAAPMRMLLAQPPSPHTRDHGMRLIIFAQNVSESQLAEWDDRFGAPLMQIYGMTEQLGHPLSNPLDYPRDNMSIGFPGLGWQIRVVDDDGNDVPEGQAGQLLVRGEPGVSLMLGYFKNPEATAEAIRDGWLWTGDNVRRGDNGYYYFVDRAKDMIKRSGENVAAGEVEEVLRQHPAVFDAAVVGVPDPIRDESILAYVILREGHAATDRELIDWAAARLAKFRVPEFVEFRAEFPRTSVGKIQKHVLRAEARERAQA